MGFDDGLYSGKLLKKNELPDLGAKGPRVYEVMRLMDSRILYGEEHLRRLENSLKFYDADFSLDYSKLYAELLALIRLSGEAYCNLRLEATLVAGKLHYTAYLVPGQYPDEAMRKEGVALKTYEYRRKDPLIKAVDPQYKQRVADFISANGIYEALLTHEGVITEGSRSNIFFVRGGQVYSPRDKDILSGITRRNLVAFLDEKKIPLIREDIPIGSLNRFEGAFLSGTSIHVLPVRAIDAVVYNPNLPLVRTIESGFLKQVEDSIKKSPVF